MGRNSRAELSKTNQYYISKERRLELEHFCHQYKEWQEEINQINYISSITVSERVKGGKVSNEVERTALRLHSLNRKVVMIERAAKEADSIIFPYLLRSVTEDRSYVNMKSVYDIPVGESTFKTIRQRFYYILDKLRD